LATEVLQIPFPLQRRLVKQGFWAGGPHLAPPRRNRHFLVQQDGERTKSHCSLLSTILSPQNLECEAVVDAVLVAVWEEVDDGVIEEEVVMEREDETEVDPELELEFEPVLEFEPELEVEGAPVTELEIEGALVAELEIEGALVAELEVDAATAEDAETDAATAEDAETDAATAEEAEIEAGDGVTVMDAGDGEGEGDWP